MSSGGAPGSHHSRTQRPGRDLHRGSINPPDPRHGAPWGAKEPGGGGSTIPPRTGQLPAPPPVRVQDKAMARGSGRGHGRDALTWHRERRALPFATTAPAPARVRGPARPGAPTPGELPTRVSCFKERFERGSIATKSAPAAACGREPAAQIEPGSPEPAPLAGGSAGGAPLSQEQAKAPAAALLVDKGMGQLLWAHPEHSPRGSIRKLEEGCK